MASISKIRYTNVIYENGNKRYNDEIFQCAGHNTAILLENGGGKTVFIQAALQAVLPHTDLGERRVKETFLLEGEAAHIAIEWIINDKPRRYGLTAVTLYLQNNELKSYKYVYEYGIDDKNSIENLPFTQIESGGGRRAASKGEMHDYYVRMAREQMLASYFETNREFHGYIEENFKIIADEWRSIVRINGEEGGVDAFFGGCKTTADLVEKLLLPTVEQGLVGDGSEEFAATFESKREHFKKHKQLENSIKESQKIKKHIADYVQDYSDYHEKLEAYQQQKEEARALWEMIVSKEEELQEIKNHLETEIEKAKTEEIDLEAREKLIEVTLAKNALEKAKTHYEGDDSLYQSEKHQKENKERQRHLLKLSQFKHEIDLAKAQIKSNMQQLENLEQDTEVANLKDELEENESFLKGYYESQLETLQKEKQKLENEQERCISEQKDRKQEERELQQRVRQLEQEMSKLSGNMENNQRSMERIKKEILSQCEHEEVAEQNKLWQKRIADIEANELVIKQNIKDIESEEKHLRGVLEEKRTAQVQCASEISQLMMQIHQLEELQEEVLAEVKRAIPSLYSLSSLYAKPEQIKDSLEEQVEKLNREKENALINERQCSYFIENYEGHMYFTAEPLLEEWVDKWKVEFSFLQTGAEFLAEAIKEEADSTSINQRKVFAKWAQLMVVADGQEEKVIGKVLAQKEKLTSPVGIVKLSEAKKTLEEGFDESNMIYPSRWEKNLRTHTFEVNKEESGRALEEAVALRKEKEVQLRSMERVLDRVRSFFDQYPHETYSQWRQKCNELRAEETKLMQSIDEIIHRQEDMEKEKNSLHETLDQEIAEKNHLVGYVEKAKHYLELVQENENCGRQYDTLKENRAEEELVLNKVEKTLQDIKEHIETLKNELNLLERKKANFEGEPLYLEVKHCNKAYSTESLEYLKERHIQLKAILENKQKGRREIEEALRSAKERLEHNQNYYHQEEQEMDGDNGEIPAYMVDAKIEIDQLTSQINELNIKLNELEKNVNKAKTDFDKKEQNFQSKKESFEETYEVITAYIENCKEAQHQLSKDRKQLKEKKTYLYTQREQVEKDLTSVASQKQLMDKKDQLYGYCAPEVKVRNLEAVNAQNLLYVLEKTVATLLKKLEKCRSVQNECENAVKASQEEFKAFCQQEIRDSKLRNMAIQGILQKALYNELLKWQENMVEQINRTIHIAEQDLIEQDKENAQFIIHLYKYLHTVAAELKEIPKKTRVKTEDGWKEIYDFDVPSWQEEEGKEKLRTYIYNLLDEIDGQGFKNPDGTEDAQKIRKYVKDQFKLKQLLKLVMGNDAIRVKCRKVSNISSISGQKFSWETSTKWSGGEKWSKNMALYLGILNYLSEKKQNIYSTGQKVSRVVILDNPFGKASSGHVLEPVFFIAKQLGFQIIALTAHTEGDFIRKYFPIVYSCKLRPTVDQTTHIFTKEQEIKKAYFIDNDPVALSVLGSKMQLSLFNN